MMNSVSRVMLTRIALPGMGMSLMDLPAKAKSSGSRISFRLAVPPPSESSWRMVSVSISRSRIWLRFGAADHGVHAKGVQQFPVLGVGGPGHGAVHTELPLGDLAGHQIVLVVAGHGHKGVAAGYVRSAQGVKADGVAAHHRDVQRVGQAAAQCFLRLNDGHLVVVGQQALGQIHAHLAAACNTNFHSITSFSKTECLKTACLLGQCPEHGLLGEHRGADGLQLVGLVVQHL